MVEMGMGSRYDGQRVPPFTSQTALIPRRLSVRLPSSHRCTSLAVAVAGLLALPTRRVGLEHVPSLVAVDKCSPIKIPSHPHTRLQSKIVCVFPISFVQERLC